MPRTWNVTGLYKAQRDRMPRSPRKGRATRTKAKPWYCPKCGKLIEFYRHTHLEICRG
jgi:hypothetical protein